jgi:hypothetical protein
LLRVAYNVLEWHHFYFYFVFERFGSYRNGGARAEAIRSFREQHMYVGGKAGSLK